MTRVNANVDVIVSAINVLKQVGIRPSLNSQDHNAIETAGQLEECFLYHFKKCAAAERFIASEELFDQLIKASVSLENAKYSVGGNSALMGLKMLYSSPNSTILLGGPVGPRLSALLDERIQVPNSVLQKVDQYHIILEYRDGDEWGGVVSKCSNRFILTRDMPNARMMSMEAFFSSLISFQPDLIVISGLHLLESEDEEFRYTRIKDLAKHLQLMNAKIPIHLELASMVKVDFLQLIAYEIFPLVDSLGLNEQELAFITVALNGPHRKDGDLRQWPPEIGVMSDILYWTLETFGKDSKQQAQSRLTRIHFHCLTYHIIAVMPRFWSKSEVAAAAGSSAVTRQACNHDSILINEVELRTPEYFARSVNEWTLRRNLVKHDQANPITSWSRNKIDFHFSAVLVCKKPKRTVGLGDCISGTGLQYSKFNGPFK
ncbi:ADP-dependent glucokinase-like isoform X2 [Rhopilema esculentum]|uniref:ADP-dependent glucokinase-like isoform X2 n=1 Tax=Rhopilema esculentum TaxID=499914 RepID=UPI0031CE7749